jgi:hypothetical protein
LKSKSIPFISSKISLENCIVVDTRQQADINNDSSEQDSSFDGSENNITQPKMDDLINFQ